MAYEDFDGEESEGSEEVVAIEFPQDIGECIDRMYAIRNERITLARKVAEYKRTENSYMLHIVDELKKVKLTGGNGSTANASYKMETIPIVKTGEWGKLWDYIVEHKAFDMVSKKLSVKAIRERWENGEVIDCLDTMEKPKLSLTKRS